MNVVAPPSRSSRPGMVTAASGVLIVLGVLVSFIGLVVVLGGAVIGGGGGRHDLGIEVMPSGPDGGFVAVVGAIIVAFGVLELLSGIFALLGRAWARILAVVMSVLGGLVALLGVIGSRAQADVSPAVSMVLLVLLVAPVFVVWAMASGGRYFTER